MSEQMKQGSVTLIFMPSFCLNLLCLRFPWLEYIKPFLRNILVSLPTCCSLILAEELLESFVFL